MLQLQKRSRSEGSRTFASPMMQLQMKSRSQGLRPVASPKLHLQMKSRSQGLQLAAASPVFQTARLWSQRMGLQGSQTRNHRCCPWVRTCHESSCRANQGLQYTLPGAIVPWKMAISAVSFN